MTPKNSFKTDPYPGKPKILFIGWPNSPHTVSWINLLENAPLNIRLFGLPTLPPENWKVRTYLTAVQSEYNPRTVYDPGLRKILRTKFHDRYNLLTQLIPFMPRLWSDEKALAGVIKSWQPDVIHTLGFDPASYFYLRTRQEFGLEKIGRWVAQARGGPDLYLNRFDPGLFQNIENVIHNCDYFIADNPWNYEYARSLGLSENKLTEFGMVSGTGGMEINSLRSAWQDPPSRRKRIIYMPKAYDNQAVKGLSAMEGIRLAWPQIKPCKIILDWVVQPEMQMWIRACLGQEIMESVEINPRLPREMSLDHSRQARVMYAPSVLDGIPNSMLEAMCCGSFPIISPLESVQGIVEDGKHVLFARNLYPEELAQALIRAMKDDNLVDSAAVINLELVRQISNREHFKTVAHEFYTSTTKWAHENKS